MPLRLVVVPNAEKQIREAARWWKQHREASPGLFRQELTRGFELIATQPEIAPRARDVDLPEVRRLHLLRIHYHLYYRLKSQEEIEVLALWHTRRGEGPPLKATEGAPPEES